MIDRCEKEEENAASAVGDTGVARQDHFPVKASVLLAELICGRHYKGVPYFEVLSSKKHEYRQVKDRILLEVQCELQKAVGTRPTACSIRKHWNYHFKRVEKNVPIMELLRSKPDEERNAKFKQLDWLIYEKALLQPGINTSSPGFQMLAELSSTVSISNKRRAKCNDSGQSDYSKSSSTPSLEETPAKRKPSAISNDETRSVTSQKIHEDEKKVLPINSVTPVLSVSTFRTGSLSPSRTQKTSLSLPPPPFLSTSVYVPQCDAYPMSPLWQEPELIQPASENSSCSFSGYEADGEYGYLKRTRAEIRQQLVEPSRDTSLEVFSGDGESGLGAETVAIVEDSERESLTSSLLAEPNSQLMKNVCLIMDGIRGLIKMIDQPITEDELHLLTQRFALVSHDLEAKIAY